MSELQTAISTKTSKGLRFLFWCMALFIPILFLLRLLIGLIVYVLKILYEGTEQIELIVGFANYIMGLGLFIGVPITILGVLLLVFKK